KKLWGLPSYVLMILIVILTSLFYPKISNEFNMLIIYKDSTVVAENAKKISEVNGGSVPVFVEISVDDVTSLAAMNQVNSLSNALSSSDSVDHVMNPYAFFNIISNMTMHSDISSDIVLGIIYQNALAENPDMITSMMNEEENKVKLIVFPKDLNNATLDNIDQVVLSEHADAITAGPQYILKDLNDKIFTMQLSSIVLAITAVFVMLLISLRSIKIAAISVVPIVISVLAIYAFLGMTGIPLNITTVMIFSITIGVGIDYAVHYSSVYRLFLKEGHSKHESVEIAYSYASRPIIANALGVAIGETILMLSPLQIHFNVSVLMWVGMITSVLMTLSVLPTILKIEKKNS
ncbi:MAG: MMPL family transporter, partial [Candidatus Izemoplasmatales bacterium]